MIHQENMMSNTPLPMRHDHFEDRMRNDVFDWPDFASSRISTDTGNDLPLLQRGFNRNFSPHFDQPKPDPLDIYQSKPIAPVCGRKLSELFDNDEDDQPPLPGMCKRWNPLLKRYEWKF